MSQFLIKVTVGGLILVSLFFLIPFKLSFPTELVEFFKGGAINQFFRTIAFFVPVNFIFDCFICVFISKYIGIFFNMILWIYNKIVS